MINKCALKATKCMIRQERLSINYDEMKIKKFNQKVMANGEPGICSSPYLTKMKPLLRS